MNSKTNEKKVILLEDEIDKERANVPITIEQYQNDVSYHYALIQLNKLLENQLISMEEFHQIEQEIRQEYHPYLFELYPL